MPGDARRPLVLLVVLALASPFLPGTRSARAEAPATESGAGEPIDHAVDVGRVATRAREEGPESALARGESAPTGATDANGDVVVAEATSPAPRPQPTEPVAHLDIGGHRIEPGTKQRIVLHASESFVGASVETPVVIIRGRSPGPTLCLTAGIHGDELNGTETVRRVLSRIAPDDLDGTLIGMPIVNVHGFRSRTRYLPDRRDLNRHFPGSPRGSSASRIAYAIFEGVIRHCDALIDFHSGSFHRSNLPQVRGDFTSTDILELARGLGVNVAVHHPGISGTLRREATTHRIPTVLYEGGESLRLQGPEIQRGVNGVLRLLRYIGMLNVPYEFEERDQEFFFDSTWVRVNHGGIFVPSVELGDRVEVDTVLATVFDPLGGERAVVRAPVAGRVIGMAMPQVVIPGFAAFHLGDRNAPRPPPGATLPEVADLEHTE